MTLKKNSVTIHPIIQCLKVIKDIVGIGSKWTAVNDKQTELLDLLSRFGLKDPEKLGDEIRYKVSQSAEEIAEFCSDMDLPGLKMDEITNKNEFYIFSILKVFIEWLEEGKVDKIEAKDSKIYPAVFMEAARSYIWEKHPNTIAAISTKRPGETVYMTVYEAPDDEFEMYNLALLFNIGDLLSVKQTNHQFIKFPMIEYDEEIDIRWVEGISIQEQMNILEDEVRIKKAKQVTRFMMDHEGARLESEVEILYECVIGDDEDEILPPLIIDSPFLLWIKRDDMRMPYFVAYFTEEYWKKPDMGEERAKVREMDKIKNLTVEEKKPFSLLNIFKRKRQRK